MTIKPALGALPAGTAAPAHEDAYADSGTSPPKGKPLPEGYVRWATASHILPTGYKCWSNDSVAQGSQQNLDTDVIRLPRTTGTLQTFLVEHLESAEGKQPACCSSPSTLSCSPGTSLGSALSRRVSFRAVLCVGRQNDRAKRVRA